MGGVPVPEKHDSAIVFLFGVVSENIQLVFRGIHQQKPEFSQQKTLMILTYNFATIGLVLADLPMQSRYVHIVCEPIAAMVRIIFVAVQLLC